MSNGEQGDHSYSASSRDEMLQQIKLLTEQVAALRSVSIPSPSVNAGSEIVDYRLLPDLDRTVPSFTGHESNHAAEDWIESVDGLATINNWPFRYRLQYVRSNVVGAARNWFLSEDFADWDCLVSKFRQAFVRQIRQSDRWEALNKRNQTPGESTVDYFYDKLRLCKALQLPFSEVRDHMLQGIRAADQAQYAMGRLHSTSSELLVDLQEWERMAALRQNRFRTTVPNPTNNRLSRDRPVNTSSSTYEKQSSSAPDAKMSEPPSNKTHFKTIRADEPNRSIQCYNCRRSGHISRDCPLPRRPVKCTQCDSDQHTRGRCPLPMDRTKPSSTGALWASAPGRAVSVNPFVKQVLLDGNVVTGLIDTGCTNVLVRSNAAKNSNLRVIPDCTPLYTVSSSDQPGVVTIGRAVSNVCIDGVMGAEHDVLVVADHVIPVDVLVGRSWLELPHVHYSKQGTEFVIETNNNIVEQVLKDPQTPVLCDVYTLEVGSMLPRVSPITLLDISVGPQSSDAQQTQLINLLNKYRDTFAKNLTELGCTNVLTMDITEVEGSVPVNLKPYRTSPSDRQAIADILSEWRDCGLISDSTSPYASPVLLANKASGEKRLCIDYRRLNKQTVNCPYPMPDVDEQLSSLAKGNLFTTLDLSNGFLQIPLSPQSKEKTAFVTEQETAKFERMPFGLKGAPGTFQKLMNFVFRDLKQSGVVNLYLDDVILPSEDWDDMLDKLEKVLEALRGARLTLKPAKCTFGSPQLDYLGFRISKGVVQPGRKVESIANYPRPCDVHEVRRFLGLAGYFRRFIVGYAELSNPLTCLTKKDVPFVWNDKQEAAFVALKSKLCEEPVVRMYDATAPITQVHTDASAVALSGILLQGDDVKHLQMVYAVSKRTTEAESKYHSSRLELFAIIWTLSRLRPYLLGVRFTVITDCQALVYLNLHKTVKPQVARWFELLQEFDFDIKYRPGSRMAHIDALSRAVHSEPMPTDSVESVLAQRLEVCLTLSVKERVRLMQQGDPPTRNLYVMIQMGNQRTAHEDKLVQDYQVLNGLVYRKYKGDKLLLVIPKSMRKGIVIAAHDLQGHFALERTVEIITQDYWFVGLWRYVRQHINMCLDCLVHKQPSGKSPGLLHPIPPGKRPFQVIHVDHLGPFETTVNRKRYLLVVVDNLTKFILLYPTSTTDAAGVIKVLTQLCEERGLPDRIISDRGTCFTARSFQEFCQLRGIRHTLNSTRHPQANGQVERANRTILPLLSMTTEEHHRWDAKLPEIQRHLNNAMNKTTTKTPFEALHGYRPRFHGGELRQLSQTANLWMDPAVQQGNIRESILAKQLGMKREYDKGHYEGIQFGLGEVVVMKRQPRLGEPSKLQAKYRVHPMQVIQVLPSDTYRVADLASDGRHLYSTTAHVSQLKSWKVLQEEEEEESDDVVLEAHADQKETVQQPTIVEGGQSKRPTRKRRTPAYLQDYDTSDRGRSGTSGEAE